MSLRLNALLLLLFLAFMGINAKEATKALANDATQVSAQPKAATWLERTHDFGLIDEDGGKVGCTMRLVNTTDSALSIIEVRSSCGCTNPEFPTRPIAPGKKAKIKVKFNPAGGKGGFRKTIIVKTNGREKRTSLYIEGSIIPRK